MCNLTRDWVDYCTALIPIFLTFFGIFIAAYQCYINHRRLKIERFDRMYSVFEGTKRFLEQVIVKRKVEDNDRFAFLKTTQGAQFIFDKTISKYLDSIYAKATYINVLNAEGAEKAKELHDVIVWLSNQLQDIENRFKRYF